MPCCLLFRRAILRVYTRVERRSLIASSAIGMHSCLLLIVLVQHYFNTVRELSVPKQQTMGTHSQNRKFQYGQKKSPDKSRKQSRKNSNNENHIQHNVTMRTHHT